MYSYLLRRFKRVAIYFYYPFNPFPDSYGRILFSNNLWLCIKNRPLVVCKYEIESIQLFQNGEYIADFTLYCFNEWSQ